MNRESTTPALTGEPPTVQGRYSTYQPRLPWNWWQGNPRYRLYMLRELSSVFIAIWGVRVLIQLDRLRRGREDYDRFLAEQRRPAWMAFNLVSFLFALLHSVTWFQLTGVVMSGMAQKVRIGDFKLNARIITIGAFGSWAAASIGVLLGLLFGGRKK